MADLLDATLARDPGRPFLTWYDDRTGERLELSVSTYANWVAKTAAMVADGYGLGPGDEVAVVLPRHWQRSVWCAAAWRAGCGVVLDLVAGAGAALVATGSQGASAVRGDVVALALQPMGGPFPAGELAPGAVDYAVEVPGYPDRFPARQTDEHAVGLRTGERVLTARDINARAEQLAALWGVEQHGRLLVSAALDPVDDILAATVLPLLVDGSVVLRTPPGEAPDGLAAAERVTATAG
jgi:uncharacterized protein (TIGR03089 family)